MATTRNALIVAAVVVVAGAGGWFFYSQALKEPEEIVLPTVTVQQEANLKDIAADFVMLPVVSAADGPGMVGLVLSRKKGTEDWTRDFRFRPRDDAQIIRTALEEQLFDGYVLAKATFGGRFELASASASADDLAQVTIKNTQALDYSPSAIPFADLYKLPIEPDMDYLFIEHVIVSDVTSQRYQKRSGAAEVSAGVRANGEVYTQQGTKTSQKLVFCRPIVLPLPPTPPADAPPEVKSAMEAAARNRALSTVQSDMLSKYLREKPQVELNATSIKTFNRAQILAPQQ
jgi:hypothetical protein